MPENLDATMRLLFAGCQGDAAGLEELLRSRVDVDSIDLDGRTALHIAACEGQGEVVRLLLVWKANINAYRETLQETDAHNCRISVLPDVAFVQIR